MAVVQISRIQVRRGQKQQGSGLPQLASGEIGWAIDTRELFIGNGSVSEGSPQVGNTKILTEYDDIFSLANTYSYRSDDGFIVTGVDATSPVTRTLQDRLDDRVSVKAFGLSGTADQDATVELQRALDQLYLNDATKGSEASRVMLHIEPGVYRITDTIYIPPNVTLIGAGSDKTVIRQEATDAPIFVTVNDSSSPGTPANDASSTFNNQARNIQLNGLSLVNMGLGKGLVLQSCRDSVFEDLVIQGSWTQGDSGFGDKKPAIELSSLSGAVESSSNKFINCKIKNFDYAVISNWDVNYNTWSECEFSSLGYGIVFGENMSLGAPGQVTGPSNNTVKCSVFENIDRQAIWIENGVYNVSDSNVFTLVGNDAGTEGEPVYSVIKFSDTGNESKNDFFGRTAALSYDQANIATAPYIPEIEGPVNSTLGFEHELTISSGSNNPLFRLPQNINQGFEIDYIIVSNSYEVTRNGTLQIVVDSRNETVEVSDEYHFNGDEIYLDNLIFSANLVDVDMDGNLETVYISATSTMPGDDSTTFKFKIKNKQTDIV